MQLHAMNVAAMTLTTRSYEELAAGDFAGQGCKNVVKRCRGQFV
jgi:hypothetical protein